MMAIMSRLRSVWTVTRDELAPDGNDERVGARANSELFECPSCGIVYIADEKTTCSSCEDAVEQVDSTLAEG